MELDKRTIGAILLVIGIVLFVGGWFCAASSLGSMGRQPNGELMIGPQSDIMGVLHLH